MSNRSKRSEQIRYDTLRLLQCSPQISNTEIGRRVGVSRERVRQILGNRWGTARGVPLKIHCRECGTLIRAQDNYTAYKQHLCMKHFVPKRVQWVELTCEICSAPFWRTSSEIRSAKNQGQNKRFCSKYCLGKWAGDNYGFAIHGKHGGGWGVSRPYAERLTFTCEVCSKEFQIRKRAYDTGAHRGRFCSNACRVKEKVSRSGNQGG